MGAFAAGQVVLLPFPFSDLTRSKLDKFSLDMLVTLATRAGLHCELKLAA
ncbi:MAG: hypothetical protein Q8J70_08185 [Thiobacillus sp.]|nr:hypothetical protein [Thiobacillus sp.]